MVKPTVVSTFAGCGGSSLGYKMAGYRELLATDFDDNSIETFKRNFKGVPVLQADICTLQADDVLKMIGLKRGELDVLDGSPPCQGFSNAGRRKVKDARNDLFREYVRLIRDLAPRVFVMENVQGMAQGKMKGRFIEIIQTLKSLDYVVEARLMNSKYYGVPQARPRLIFIGVRKDLGLGPVFPKGEGRLVTVRQAFKGLPPQVEDRPMKDAMRQACRHITPGMGVRQMGTIFVRFLGSPAGSFAARRLSWVKPSPTIVKEEIAHAGLIHPEEDRYLTASELKRLATFPDDFWFSSRRDTCARIGNAVMPRFMYHLAKTIKEEILDRAEAGKLAGNGPRRAKVTRPRGGQGVGKGVSREASL